MNNDKPESDKEKVQADQPSARAPLPRPTPERVMELLIEGRKVGESVMDSFKPLLTVPEEKLRRRFR